MVLNRLQSDSTAGTRIKGRRKQAVSTTIWEAFFMVIGPFVANEQDRTIKN